MNLQHPSPISGVNALWMVETHYTAGDHIPAHLHWYYHLFMVRRGTAELTVQGVRRTLSDGAFLFVRPGVEHSMLRVTSPTAVCVEVRIVTMTPQAEKLLLDLPDAFPATPFVTHLVDEMIAENSSKDAASAGFISDYFLALSAYLHRHYGSSPHPDSGLLDTRGFSELSRAIIQYLSAHLTESLPLQKIADAMGYHKNYICTAFRQDTGMTVGNCLLTLRIRKAAELLSLSDMDLKEISTSCGFVNFSHFTRAFKQATGTPPGQYRRRLASDMIALTLPGLKKK
jgi:AraC-like DNA-binding protein/quercetin dioxygenase-like cupin family protein